MLNGLFPNYKVYCTLKQSNKASILGAPYGTNVIPTVEQMIDWLETQGIHIYTHKIKAILCHDYKTCIAVWETKTYNTILQEAYFSSKEAVLAGIDAALEYLSNNKK